MSQSVEERLDLYLREIDESTNLDEEEAGQAKILELGRKERILFNYLRQRSGRRVPWQELAGAYFADSPDMLEDDDKALRAVRAAVNRININNY